MKGKLLLVLLLIITLFTTIISEDTINCKNGRERCSPGQICCLLPTKKNACYDVGEVGVCGFGVMAACRDGYTYDSENDLCKKK